MESHVHTAQEESGMQVYMLLLSSAFGSIWAQVLLVSSVHIHSESFPIGSETHMPLVSGTPSRARSEVRFASFLGVSESSQDDAQD